MCYFVGPLISLFQASVDVYHGFQSQDRPLQLFAQWTVHDGLFRFISEYDTYWRLGVQHGS